MVRLADLLAGLSRVADLGFGLTAGEALRSCVVACALARSLDLSDGDIRAAFYTALLQHVGCTGYAHELANLFDDELAFGRAAGRANLADPGDILTTFIPVLTGGKRPVARIRLAFATVSRGNKVGRAYTTAACEVGRDVARRLNLPDDVQRGVYHVYELWRGAGHLAGLTGDEIPIGSRIARLASVAVTFDSIGGPDLAVEAVRRRSGGMLDPWLVGQFTDVGRTLLDELNAADPLVAALDAEPGPAVTVPDDSLVEVARVFGEVADLKSPFLHGHSPGVAALARRAGAVLGLAEAAQRELELAALLHDVGRVAISDALWEKPAGLTAPEWEQVRLHAYHSERVLAGSRSLAPLAPLAGRHHERLDGSGYHRQCGGPEIAVAARVLAAADAFQAMTQRRPYRAALPPERAEQELQEDVRAGRLDADAVRAVLGAAGRAVTVPGGAGGRHPRPAGLTDREVEVLALVASGCSNTQIAQRLVISRRTAEHHVQHIYAKIGVSSRAAAALFAMEHRLLPDRNG